MPKREPFEIYPIKRIDVYESVLDQLNRLVRTLEPGDQLPTERQLVAQLNVSRVSVREALRALETLGKIEIRRNAGSFVLDPKGAPIMAHFRNVAPVDETYLGYLVDVRAAIEDRVVIGAISALTDDIESIGSMLTQFGAELDEEPDESGSLDLRFEAALGALTKNPLLIEFQRVVHQLWVEAWSECGIAPGDRLQLHKEHEAIFHALRDGDETLARRRMAEHVDRTVVNAAPKGR